MSFVKASQTKKHLKIALGDINASQNVFNALRIAKGITSDTSKICGIESSSGSFAEFSDKMDIAVLQIPTDSNWQPYFEAIRNASKAGYETIIVNGLSTEWQNVKSQCIGKGQNTWLKPKGERQGLRSALLKSQVNIIALYELKPISEFPKEAQAKINNKTLVEMGVAFEMEKVDFASFPTLLVRSGKEHITLKDESGKLPEKFTLTSELFKGL